MAADPQSAEYHTNVLSFQAPTSDLSKSIGNLTNSDTKAAEFACATLYDLLRADGSVFNALEAAIPKTDFTKQAMGALQASKTVFIADKAAWILSAAIGNIPKAFSEGQVSSFLSVLQGAQCSEQGRLDAAVNVLKASAYRQLIVNIPSFIDMGFDAQTTSPGLVYKKMFALWLLEGKLPLSAEAVVQKLKEVLTYSRVEKVVRMTLMCLQGLLASGGEVGDEVVEQGLLEVVQALEYEKWRDAELFEDIKGLSAQLAQRTAELSSFARYERELSTGKLKWGFIHSPKFWSENVLKFEQNDWRALKALSTCLAVQGEPTTVAVACRDLGEFVTAHPLGKKQLAGLGVKDKVMQLMSSNSSDKEVRREALLCCQKIMLNKWQDVETA